MLKTNYAQDNYLYVSVHFLKEALIETEKTLMAVTIRKISTRKNPSEILYV